MNPTRTAEENSRLRREKSREAVTLALEGNWEKAVEANREVLGCSSDDVEALNRLGKALMELGRYPEAKDAFENASKLAPYNAISRKNLERLSQLQDTAAPLPKQCKVATPYLFIEESGKSGVTHLQKPAQRRVLAKMASGDSVQLHAGEHSLMVETDNGEYLGQVEPRLGMRLMRLMKLGNRYGAAILSINRQEVSIIIRETYHNPDLGNVFPFPARSKDEYKVYSRDTFLRYYVDNRAGQANEDYASEWTEDYPEGPESSDDDESSDDAIFVNTDGMTDDEEE